MTAGDAHMPWRVTGESHFPASARVPRSVATKPHGSHNMKHHTIVGGGGCRLHVMEAGHPHGQPILFLHGFSQCSLAWSRQLSSDLANSHRLVAMDLRGHGSSDKPRDVYGDSKLWADDVNAVIGELELDQPILCGWSYGPLV